MDELNRMIDNLYDMTIGDHIAIIDIRERMIDLRDMT